MTLFQGANPFPNCVCEAEAIIIIGYLIASMIFVILLMVLMIYCYAKINSFLPILVVFLFSIIIGMVSFVGSYLPFTPWFQLFFVLFQAIVFYLKLEKTNFKMW